MEFLLVGLGGSLGALARYLVYLFQRWLGPSGFPWATLGINLTGCLLAGFFLAIGEKQSPGSRTWMLFVSMGFVGSFTTFSTYSVESFQLLRSGLAPAMLASVAANTVIGLAAVAAGYAVALKI